METTAAFGETDNGLTANQMDITVKTMAGVSVDTTGWSMELSQRGSYKVEVPLCTVRSTIFLKKKTDATVFYDGFIGPDVWDIPAVEHVIPGSTGQYLQSIGLAADPWLAPLPDGYASPQAGFVLVNLQTIFEKFTTALNQLLTQTYNAGQVISPYSSMPGPNIQIFVKTNYYGIATVGVKWAPYLSIAGAKVFFTAKQDSSAKVNVIDVECAVTDATLGVIDVKLNKTQTNIKVGEYYWQLEVRTFAGAEVDEVWVMQEGKIYAKQSFKAL